MDFFSAVADPSQPILHNDRAQDNSNECFAEAIANRFGSGALLTTRLTPVSLAPPTLRLPASPVPVTPTPRNPGHPSALPPTPAPPLQFLTITPATVGPWTDDPTALLLDIRAHAAYSAARVPCAVSLSVPSTLLKRPLFSLLRLADMLPSANARARFSAWRSASRILVYDADSSSIPETSNIYGLLRKFKNDGFQGDLAWLEGGFQAVWRERREIIDADPPTPDVENDDEDEDMAKALPTQPQSSVLRTRHLPLAAFSFSSTTVNDPSNPKRGPVVRGATFPTLPAPAHSLPQPAFNPFFDAVRQNLELSQGITERIPLRLSRRVRHRIHDLPFPWLCEIARRSAKLAPRNHSVIDFPPSTSEESEDDENTTSADVEEGKEALAMQFFKIEVAEQRRLMGIMEHHTKETTIVTSDMGAAPSSNFPYSITAGVEKGTKNRYRHIWPFEHARVRLHQRRETDDDYVNASYVQPLGTNKRYIATQGPLPATFTDFWTLCWEQNVHVIVMLTREVENSMVKCGSYWTDTEHGPLRLRLVSTTGASPPAEEPGLFPTRPAPQRYLTSPVSQTQQQRYPNKHISRHHTHKSEIIRRVFELTHTNYPDAPPRRMIHLQYLEWPDLNVPDDPRGILQLINEVNDAMGETQGHVDAPPVGSSSALRDAPLLTLGTEVDEKTGVSKQALDGNRPVLLHCSAGVGRTGGFIAVDAVLDAIRREMRGGGRRDEDAMDVDVPSRPSPAPVVVSSVAAEKGDPMPQQEPSMETVSITISAGNGPKASKKVPGYAIHVPVVSAPSSNGTDPEASGSEREHPFPEKMSTAKLTVQTRAWAEDVSRGDQTIAGLPGTNQQQSQPGLSESESNTPSSSKNAQLPIPSDSSSSSNHSLLDLSGANGHSGATVIGNHIFLHSSSFATSLATISSPGPSPPRKELLSHSSKDIDLPLPPSTFLSVDHIPVRPVSEPRNSPKSSADDGFEARSRLAAGMVGKGSGAAQQSSGWLGEPLRNRSPSPMARTTSGDSAAASTSRSAKPSFTLRAPPYTGGISSDAEPPSRSVSPSADEGSVASQVSLYHSYLKDHHHYHPTHHKSLPISLDKPDKGKGMRTLGVPAPVPERFTSPVPSQSALTGHSSGSATAVDFKRPRPLHDTAAPLLLSSLDEPIQEVVQDMREQRMSLCQSLRQYVFVHAAVLEGTLMIVDEERELVKARERQRLAEMGGIKIDSRRSPEEAERSMLLPLGGSPSESSNAGGSSAKSGESNRLNADPDKEISGAAGVSAPGIGWGSGPGPFLGESDMVSVSTSTTHPSSSSIDPNRMVQDGGDGYFGNFISQPPITFGLSVGEGMDEGTVESVFSPRPRVPAGAVFPSAGPSLQRPRLSALDARFGKRSTSPSDYFRDGGGLDDDTALFKRPSVKRKQPSGEAGEAVTRKRAQNESSSRERERERERERQLERRLSSSSHSHPRDGPVDVLTSGLVR